MTSSPSFDSRRAEREVQSHQCPLGTRRRWCLRAEEVPRARVKGNKDRSARAMGPSESRPERMDLEPRLHSPPGRMAGRDSGCGRSRRRPSAYACRLDAAGKHARLEVESTSASQLASMRCSRRRRSCAQVPHAVRRVEKHACVTAAVPAFSFSADLGVDQSDVADMRMQSFRSPSLRRGRARCTGRCPRSPHIALSLQPESDRGLLSRRAPSASLLTITRTNSSVNNDS